MCLIVYAIGQVLFYDAMLRLFYYDIFIISLRSHPPMGIRTFVGRCLAFCQKSPIFKRYTSELCKAHRVVKTRWAMRAETAP